ncbi:hypothetical protein ACWDUL_33585 [Nocardia niigatensis]
MADNPAEHKPIEAGSAYDSQTQLIRIPNTFGHTATFTIAEWRDLVRGFLDDPGTGISEGEEYYYDPARQRPVFDNGYDRLIDLTPDERAANDQFRVAAQIHSEQPWHPDVLTAYTTVVATRDAADTQRWEEQARFQARIAAIELEAAHEQAHDAATRYSQPDGDDSEIEPVHDPDLQAQAGRALDTLFDHLRSERARLGNDPYFQGHYSQIDSIDTAAETPSEASQATPSAHVEPAPAAAYNEAVRKALSALQSHSTTRRINSAGNPHPQSPETGPTAGEGCTL